MLKKLTIVLGMALAVAGMTTVSSFVFVPEAQAWGLKSVAKKAGKGIKKGAKTGWRKAKNGNKSVQRKLQRFDQGTRKAGKYVGRTTKRGGKFVGRGTKKFFTGDAVPKAAARFGRKTGRIAKRGGRAFKRQVKCLQTRVCGRIGDLPAGTKGNPRPAVRDHRS